MLFACSSCLEFLVLIWIFLVLSVGAANLVDNESVPLQQAEHPQGKQFDHVPFNPITLKSTTLFNLYVCMLLCQMINLSYRGS